MISLDRFEQGLPDIQENDYGLCRECGEGLSNYRECVSGICDGCAVVQQSYNEWNYEEE